MIYKSDYRGLYRLIVFEQKQQAIKLVMVLFYNFHIIMDFLVAKSCYLDVTCCIKSFSWAQWVKFYTLKKCYIEIASFEA